MIEIYFIAKWLHITSATVLLGTGAGTAFQLHRAYRSRDPRIAAAAARTTIVADWFFTTPAIILQPATGIVLAALTATPLTSPWLLASYALYSIALGCWIPVIFLQYRFRSLALSAMRDNRPLDSQCATVMRRWYALGWPALFSILLIYALMIARPDF